MALNLIPGNLKKWPQIVTYSGQNPGPDSPKYSQIQPPLLNQMLNFCPELTVDFHERPWMELIGILPTRCNWIPDRLFSICMSIRALPCVHNQGSKQVAAEGPASIHWDMTYFTKTITISYRIELGSWFWSLFFHESIYFPMIKRSKLFELGEINQLMNEKQLWNVFKAKLPTKHPVHFS